MQASSTGSSDARAPRRIGVFGGSFEPVHSGHLELARRALRQFGLAEVRFVPARQPPHKRDRALMPARERLELLRLALAGEPRFVLDRREIESAAAGYTIDTLRGLRRELPAGTEIVFLLGGDQLAELPDWHRARELVREFTLAALPRPDADLDATFVRLAAAFPAEDVARLRAHLIEGPPLAVSATEVRERLAAGRPLDDLVPPPVARRLQARE